jgi:hypothetical protein
MDRGMQFNPMPGIDTYSPNNNPTITSPNSPFTIQFYQTRETLMDVDEYRNFLKNAEARFRHSIRYNNYKAFLCGLGLDHCQVHGFIKGTDGHGDGMATVEMHHAILTLFDICLMITEHILNTVGYVTTFDVVQALKEEHMQNNIAIVMLSKTPHQLYHNDSNFYIHPDMCFGNWPYLIRKYKDGITQDLAFKILYYLKKALEKPGTDDAGLLDLRDEILDWSAKLS